MAISEYLELDWLTTYELRLVVEELVSKHVAGDDDRFGRIVARIVRNVRREGIPPYGLVEYIDGELDSIT